MHIRLPCLAALSVVVLVGTCPEARAAGVGRALSAARQRGPVGEPTQGSPAERRLLILEAPGNALTKTARERLHAAIAEVATAEGLTLASRAGLPEKLFSCDLPGCLGSIAAASGAIFVLRVDAKFAKESFKLAVELWNSDEGKLLGKERRDCPICDEQDLWGSAAFIARTLLERAVRESADAAQPAKPAGSARAMPSLAGMPAPAPALTQTPAPSPTSLAVLRYSGLALSVAGVAALATGIYYWSVDGDRAGDQSDYVRDTKKLGLPLTIAGGAALVVGAAMVGWSFWSGAAKVAVGPSGLRVAGRF